MASRLMLYSRVDFTVCYNVADFCSFFLTIAVWFVCSNVSTQNIRIPSSHRCTMVVSSHPCTMVLSSHTCAMVLSSHTCTMVLSSHTCTMVQVGCVISCSLAVLIRSVDVIESIVLKYIFGDGIQLALWWTLFGIHDPCFGHPYLRNDSIDWFCQILHCWVFSSTHVSTNILAGIIIW